MSEVRLQKALAAAGVASRRRCEELMASGLVEVNGEVVTRMGAKVDPHADVIRVDGKRVAPAAGHSYVILNKPTGVVSTMSDERGRPDLSRYLTDRDDRLFHVGRLDTDTSGLLMLTNDGSVAHHLAHPSFEISKTYVALVDGQVSKKTVTLLTSSGVSLDDGDIAADRFTVQDSRGGKSVVELDLHSGRNRIVRRMLDAVGHPVIELTRTAFGPLRLGSLGVGDLRDLTNEERGALFDSVQL